VAGKWGHDQIIILRMIIGGHGCTLRCHLGAALSSTTPAPRCSATPRSLLGFGSSETQCTLQLLLLAQRTPRQPHHGLRSNLRLPRRCADLSIVPPSSLPPPPPPPPQRHWAASAEACPLLGRGESVLTSAHPPASHGPEVCCSATTCAIRDTGSSRRLPGIHCRITGWKRPTALDLYVCIG
jgi:hypothetical protein